MSNRNRNCEICGVQERRCKDKMFFARFPLREPICRQWVKVVGKEDLAYLPILKLNQLRYVCGKHFEKRDFTKSKTRLKKNAIPKLDLTMPPLSEEILVGFPLKMAESGKVLANEGAAPVPVDQTKQIGDEVHQPIGAALATEGAAPVLMDLTNQIEDEVHQPKQRRTVQAFRRQLIDDADQVVTLSCSQAQAVSNDQRSASNSGAASSSSQLHTTLPSSSNTDPSPLKIGAALPVHQVNQEAKGTKRMLPNDFTELSPRKKKLVKDLRATRCTLRSLRKSASLIDNLDSPILKEIVLNAAKNQNRKPKGRRWTVKNKISALAIFKRSPRTYRFLSQVVPLPSEKTLQNILKKVPMEPGINKSVLQHLRKIAPLKNEKDKLCCLLFDEMAIKPRLILNTGTDYVEGFEDLGELGRNGNVADHALVFMLQGLMHKFKQPVAFFFTKGTISSQNLAALIKNIITEVSACGFKILNTVCDQGPKNVGAQKVLREMSGPRDDESNHYFIHNGEKVYFVYNVPHLYKSIRNNFLNYGTILLGGKVGKWAHLLELKKVNESFLYLSKITEAHINPKYRQKMRVKYAAQILSNTVSALLKLLWKAENNEIKKKELMETALVIEDLDKLFDITNGPSGPADKKKQRRENVSLKTNHYIIWADYIKKMKTVKFIKNGNPAKNVKCIEGYITTLKSLREIWLYVSQLGFKYFNLRQLNQDALEKLFGIIRQQSPTNRHPTATHFIAALKTAVITKAFRPQIRGANCENDKKFLLTGFQNLVFKEDENNIENEAEVSLKRDEEIEKDREREEEWNFAGIDEVPVISIPEFAEEAIEEQLTNITGQAVVYVSGYMASRMIKNHHCEECRHCLSVDNPKSSMYDYISLREWWQDKLSLTYPAVNLCKMVQTATDVTETEIVNMLHEKNIINLAVTMFEIHCDATWFSCQKHAQAFTKLFYKKLAVLLIRRACQRINTKYVLQEVSVADTCKKAEQQGKAK